MQPPVASPSPKAIFLCSMRYPVLVMLIVLLTSCLLSCSQEPITCHEFMMDTQCAITVYDRADEKYIEQTFALIRDLDDRLDRYDEDSEIAMINRNAGIAPVCVSEQTFEIVSRAKELSEATDGAFNPLLGAISSLWAFDSPVHEVPDAALVSSLVEHVDIDCLVLDEEHMSVFLTDGALQLDLGAIAKGHASQMAADHLASCGVERAIVNLGGNVYCLGGRSPGEDWVVGIQNPQAATGGYFATVRCSDAAVVTSGSYQRHFEVDGVDYHHILDPATGWPAESDILSVSIISPDGALADALSTACFVLGSRGAEGLCRRMGVGMLVLTSSGEIIRLDA